MRECHDYLGWPLGPGLRMPEVGPGQHDSIRPHSVSHSPFSLSLAAPVPPILQFYPQSCDVAEGLFVLAFYLLG